MARSNRLRNKKKAAKTRKQTSYFSKALERLIFFGEKRLDHADNDLHSYTKKRERLKGFNVEDVPNCLNLDKILWLQVRGLHDTEIIRRLGELFYIQTLLLEDILSTYQLQKLESFGFRHPISNHHTYLL